MDSKKARSVIFEELKERMKWKEKGSKAFISIEDIKSVWSDESRIIAVLPSTSPQVCRFIRECLIKILSILIWIGAHDDLDNFYEKFINVPVDQRRTDINLPLEEGELKFLSPDRAHQFYAIQFGFIPEVIEDNPNQKTQIVHESHRLPFESVQKDVGVGGYGKVDRVGISPGYLKQQSGSVFTEVSWNIS
jgi:hypothetical protein